MTRLKTLLIAAIMPFISLAGPIEASVITCFPGSEIYELEGHSGLRLRDSINDITVNWGLFDFNAPNFVYRFVKGETDYRAGACPTDMFVGLYAGDGRKVMEQWLNLTARQAETLTSLVRENLRPENRVYRYNYVKDNCSTRILDMIERAIGDTVSLGVAPENITGDHPSFRNSMRHYHATYPWYQFGIDLALGSGLDRPISNREQGYAPVTMFHLLEKATIPDSTGRQVPLVLGTTVLNEGLPQGASLPPTPFWQSPLFISWILFIVTLSISINDIRRKRLTRWLTAVIYSVSGVAGLIITFLIFISEHEATSPNWLYLWLNPLCFIPAICVWLKKGKITVYSYQIVNFVALILLIILWSVNVQSLNPAFLPLILCNLVLSATYIGLYQCHTRTRRQ